MPIGVDTTITTRPAAARPGLPATARTFMCGLADRGPINTPTRVNSLPEFERVFGTQVSYSEAYTAVRYHLIEGGSELWFSRAAGPAATRATVSQASSVAYNAASVGTWGANLSVVIAAGTLSGFKVTVRLSGVTVESNDNLADGAAIVAAPWTYIAPTSLGATAPTNATLSLTGGSDDRASVVWSTSIDSFTDNMGAAAMIVPGIPYSTTVGTGTLFSALQTHCDLNGRIAYVETVATAIETDMINAANALRSSSARNMALVGTRPTVTVGTSLITIPASAYAAAKRARAHKSWGPGRGASGDVSVGEAVTGVVATMSSASVSAATDAYQYMPIVVDSGVVKIMGERSLSTVSSWRRHATADLVNIVREGATLIGKRFVFRPIDGKGRTIAEFGAALTGYLAVFADPATPNVFALEGSDGRLIDPGYIVDVGPTVNTPATILLSQLNAVIYIRPMPSAEWIRIELVNVGS